MNRESDVARDDPDQERKTHRERVGEAKKIFFSASLQAVWPGALNASNASVTGRRVVYKPTRNFDVIAPDERETRRYRVT